MRVLSIETSCDETSLALVETTGGLKAPQFKIQKHLIASQVETHRPWGGVVPNLAKREHAENLPKLFEKLTNLKTYKLTDLIAVTVGPGLEPCLWQGIEFAKTIKKASKASPESANRRTKEPTKSAKAPKIIGVNHLHGHMYSFLLTPRRHPERSEGSRDSSSASRRTQNDIFPAVQLLVSGGHTILIYMKSLTDYKKLGETRDDAAGEAFDKVARMLGLPYPGGPEIEALAQRFVLSKRSAAKDPIVFPRPMINSKNYDFSFSGLKTSVLYYLRNQKQKNLSTYKLKNLQTNIAASFQQAAIDVLVSKTLRAAKEYNAKSVILSGGVAANSALRKLMKLQAKSYKLNFLSADKKFQGDNAAMIAVAGYITHLRKKQYPLKANGSLNL